MRKSLLLSTFLLTVLATEAAVAQTLTLSTGASSGSGWSASGTNPVTLTVSANTTIGIADIQSYLNQGISVVVDNTAGTAVAFNGSVAKTTGSAARLTVKSGGSITTGANLNISSTSSALDVILWADANANGTGSTLDNIVMEGGLTVSTNGGHFYAAGGSDGGANGGVANDGLPDGYAYSGTGAAAGLRLGIIENTNGALISISTAGGNMVFRGSSSSNASRPGLATQGKLMLNAGTGSIVMNGISTVNHAIELSYGQQPQIAMTSASTATPAISVVGTSTVSLYGYGIFFGKQHTGNLLIQSTSNTGGGVTFSGSTASNVIAGVYLGFNEGQDPTHLVQLLSKTGPIQLLASSAYTTGMFLNVDLYLGNAKNNTAVQGITPAVTNSSADISVRAPKTIEFKANSTYPARFSTTGTSAVMSTSAASTTALDITGYFDIGAGMTSFNFGEVGANYNFALLQNISSPSPLKFYAYELSIVADVATTNASSIEFFAKQRGCYGTLTPTVAASSKKITVSTQNGAITFHHDYDLNSYCLFWTYEMDINAGTGHATLKWPADFGASVNFPKFYGTGPVSVIHCGAGGNSFPNLELQYLNYDADNNGFEHLTIGSPGSTRFIDIRQPTTFKGPVTINTTHLNMWYGITVTTGDFTLNANYDAQTGSPFAMIGQGISIQVAGKFILTPMNAGFINTLNFPYTNPTVTSNGIVLGKSGMTSNIAFTPTTTVTGDLELHGSTVTLGGNVTASGNVIISGSTLVANHNLRTNGNLTLSSSTSNVAAGKYLWADGNFTNNGNLTLSAENASDGAYAQLKFGGTFTAGAGSSITQQQYLESGRHLMGAPFNSTTAALFGGSSAASGGVGNSGTGYPANNYNLFGWSGSDWQVLADNNAAIVPGKGYIGHVGTNGFRLTEGIQSFTGTTPNTSVSYSFLDQNANASVSVDNSGTLGARGWNLVANPFTCALNPSTITSHANMKAAVYRWDPKDNGGNGRYNPHSPAADPAASHIAPLQAFWIQTNNTTHNTTLSMATHGTVSQSPVFRKTGEFEADRLRFRVERNAEKSYWDEAFVAMAEGTVDGFDDAWDAHELNSGSDAVYLYSYVSGDASMANNAIPYSHDKLGDKVIPMAFKAPGQGETYTLELDQALSSLPYDVLLEDLHTGRVHTLSDSPYTFVNETSVEKRFEVRFRSDKTRQFNAMGSEENGLLVWKRDQSMVFWMSQLGAGSWTLLGVDGREILGGSLQLDGTRVQEVALPTNVTPGIYWVRVRFSNGNTAFTRIML